jgi:hypothetical protein
VNDEALVQDLAREIFGNPIHSGLGDAVHEDGLAELQDEHLNSSSEHGVQPLRTIALERIEMRSIQHLEKPLIQDCAFTLLAGPKGVGKGTWLAGEIAKMTTGGYKGHPARNVLIVSSEDSASIDLKPRAIAAGADPARIHVVMEHFVLPADLVRLEQTALAVGDVGMIVLDPIGNHLGGADTDKEGAVRFAVQGLNRLADKLACVVFGVRHIGKSRENGALASVLGSTAWVDLPRCVLAFAADDEDPLRFHVEVVAGNRSGRGVGRVYRIELADVGLLEPVTKAMPEGDSTKHVDDLLVSKQRASKSQSARDLILDILENEGDQESDALDARVAREAAITAKTVRNLRGELKNEGLLKAVPVTSNGAVDHWTVVRTAAPRP